MFAAVDAGDTELANKIDGAEVDPSFAEIETRIDAAATAHHALAAENLTSSRPFKPAFSLRRRSYSSLA